MNVYLLKFARLDSTRGTINPSVYETARLARQHGDIILKTNPIFTSFEVLKVPLTKESGK